MSDNTDSKHHGHCKIVSKTRASYESHIATEKGLVELGKHMAKKENYKQKRAEKYTYLLTAIKEFDGFNGHQFIHSVQSCDKNLVVGKMQSLVDYVSILKELYNHHTEDIADRNTEIENLRVENIDMGDMVDVYIEEIDTKDSKLETIYDIIEDYKSIVETYKMKMVEHSNLINMYKKKIGLLNSEDQSLRVNVKLEQDGNQLRMEDDQREIRKLLRYKNIARINSDNQKKDIAELRSQVGENQTFHKRYLFMKIVCGVIVTKYLLGLVVV